MTSNFRLIIYDNPSSKITTFLKENKCSYLIGTFFYFSKIKIIYAKIYRMNVSTIIIPFYNYFFDRKNNKNILIVSFNRYQK